MTDQEQRKKELQELLKSYDDAYYREARPEVSDQEYDRLKREFESLFDQDDFLSLLGSQSETKPGISQTPIVGDDRLEEFISHKHISPMLSLDNTYDEAEFFDFDKRLRKILGSDTLSYVVEPKVDGVAVSLTYENGVLSRATTRGNGVEGDIITQNILHIQNLPFHIKSTDFPTLIEIRGEIFMSHEEFNFME